MFKKDLASRFKTIFGMQKVTFDAPKIGPEGTFEQETLFVEVDIARTKVTGDRIVSKVTGSIVVFAQNEKMPFGFFAKQIEKADADITKELFFFDIDTTQLNSHARMINISERRCKFRFLFSTQYDPNKGKLTEVNFGD